jgi:hypothetical protein
MNSIMRGIYCMSMYVQNKKNHQLHYSILVCIFPHMNKRNNYHGHVSLLTKCFQPTPEFIEFHMVLIVALIPFFQPFHKPWFQGLELC